jgi:hypothetical protein
VLLSTLNLLAASETLGVSQEHRNAIASSIAFMVVEISHLEVVLMMDCGGVHCSGVCTVPGNLLPSTASLKACVQICCEYASAVCYSLWLYCEMLLENYNDRVSGRLLSETSTSEMAIDGRRPPCTVTSDIKRLVYIYRTVLTGRQKNNNAVIINAHLCPNSE